jgi:hypothetical protein
MPTVTPSPLDPFIPIIITLLKQTGFDSKWNAWIAIGVYAIWTVISLATGLRAVEGPITPAVVFNAFTTAAVTGYVSYQLVLKNLPGDAEARLELATSIDKGVVDEAGPGVG